MCGRYSGNFANSNVVRSIYTLAKKSYANIEFKTGEIFPTNMAPLLIGIKSDLHIIPGYWGFPGFKSGDIMINARSETAPQKPTFAEPFQYGRCIVPTTGFYEWDKQKKKYLFQKPGESTLYLAGLYKRFEDTFKYVILTTSANESIADVHHRMPVILGKDDLLRWTTDLNFATDFVRQSMPLLVKQEA